MEGVREYLLSVTCTAVLCGVLCSLTDGKLPTGALLKMLCGIFLSLTVIAPLSKVHLTDLNLDRWDITKEGEVAAEAGLEYARQAERQIIKTKTETYILDKARLYDLDLRVEIRLSEGTPPVPEAVTLRGRASPYAREQLQRMMEQDLGIPKENQQWKDADSS